jgi:SAM-dependent methyltransferase
MKNIMGVHANGMKMDFPDESFDTIMIIESLSHADEQEPVLNEAVRVLKKGGSILVLDFNNGANPRIWIRSWKQKRFEDIIENVVNPYYIRNRLIKMGFKDIVIVPHRYSGPIGYLQKQLLSKNIVLPPKFYLFLSNGFMLKAVKH